MEKRQREEAAVPVESPKKPKVADVPHVAKEEKEARIPCILVIVTFEGEDTRLSAIPLKPEWECMKGEHIDYGDDEISSVNLPEVTVIALTLIEDAEKLSRTWNPKLFDVKTTMVLDYAF